MYLKLTVKLTNDVNALVAADKSACVVNNCLSSLFSNVIMYLNGKQVSSSNGLYPYRAYMENLLNVSKADADQVLSTVGWSLDDAGKFDVVKGASDDLDNKGAMKRVEMFALSKEVELVGKLHLDLANQEKWLLNGLDMKIECVLAKNAFYAMGPKDDALYKINITGASLHMNVCEINPEILLSHEAILQRQPALYPYKRVEMRSTAFPKDISSFQIDNVMLGKIPSTMVIALVDTSALSGSYTKNPFNFQHFNLRTVEVTVNGRAVLDQPLTFHMNPTSDTRDARGYYMLYKGKKKIIII